MGSRAVLSLALTGLGSLVAGCSSAGRLAPAVDRASGSEVFDRVAELVAERFYDPGLRGVDWNAARVRYGAALGPAASECEISAAINGLLGALQTSHTHYFFADQAAFHFLVELFGLGADYPLLYPDGQVGYVGVGWFVERIDGRPFVSGVLPGSPAARAGVLSGDLILDVGGRPWQDLSNFAGRAARTVALRVQRGRDADDVLTLELVPRWLHPLQLFADAVAGSFVVEQRQGTSVAVARMWSYAGDDLQALLVEALTRGVLKDAAALVLDLRGGWGGANPADLDLFHAAVPALTMIGRDGQATVLDDRWRRPVVLLVDGGTRSGKELLAQAFQSHGLGPVVGRRTAGAVVGGRAFAVSARGLLYLAVADVTVDGIRLEGRGVEPDLVVERALPFSAGADPQRERALELAAELARGPSPGEP